jgi:excisionase family DNA binding protein
LLPELVFGKRGDKRRRASTGRESEPPKEAARDETVLLTVKELASLLGVCTATVYAMVERGELPHVRVGNAIRIVVTSHGSPRPPRDSAPP